MANFLNCFSSINDVLFLDFPQTHQGKSLSHSRFHLNENNICFVWISEADISAFQKDSSVDCLLLHHCNSWQKLRFDFLLSPRTVCLMRSSGRTKKDDSNAELIYEMTIRTTTKYFIWSYLMSSALGVVRYVVIFVMLYRVKVHDGNHHDVVYKGKQIIDCSTMEPCGPQWKWLNG